MNFFGNKHGKNGRDTHFSCLTKFIEAEKKVRKFSSSADIARAITSRQEISNEARKELSKDLMSNLKKKSILNLKKLI